MTRRRRKSVLRKRRHLILVAHLAPLVGTSRWYGFAGLPFSRMEPTSHQRRDRSALETATPYSQPATSKLGQLTGLLLVERDLRLTESRDRMVSLLAVPLVVQLVGKCQNERRWRAGCSVPVCACGVGSLDGVIIILFGIWQ